MASRIAMIQGSAVAPEVVNRVRDFARGYRRVLVCLDSMHPRSCAGRARRLCAAGLPALLRGV